jgi:CheY-like chemotaxis protein
MDVMMPEMNGFEAVKQLRQQAATRLIPSSWSPPKAEAESMEAGYESGCNDYVIKPIDQLELVTKVKSLLGE